ncbi:MAG: metallophosphoesterase [Lachnospiraceae bacterium]|nr:metallophosphoesterase [Lachnospiraceae bacterium]
MKKERTARFRRKSKIVSCFLALLLLLSACGMFKKTSSQPSEQKTQESSVSESDAPESSISESFSSEESPVESSAPDSAVSESSSAEEAITETSAAESAETVTELSPETETEVTSEEANAEQPDETTDGKNGDIVILYTSDIHCAYDYGYGLEGLAEIRRDLESQGYTTILVDNGDAVHGDEMGDGSQRMRTVELMNSLHYDASIPGNHEFDGGMDQFFKLDEMTEFPYISCNFNKEGKLVFDPYIIIEACGKKIAFVGVTTPATLSTSKPGYFKNENGDFIYGFMQDGDGEELYEAVQSAVDAARGEGADYVYLMSHLGMNAEAHPWNYADVVEHTNGIDVVLDSHSHDAEQLTAKNKDGIEVVRSACGAQMEGYGYSLISGEKGIVETNFWSWKNEERVPPIFNKRDEESGQS